MEWSRALFILPTFYPTSAPGREGSLPFFQSGVRDRTPLVSFDKSTPLGRDNCFLGLPPSERQKLLPPPAYRYPFQASFLPLAAENIASRFVFFLLPKRSTGKNIVPEYTDRPSISLRQARIYGSDIAPDKI